MPAGGTAKLAGPAISKYGHGLALPPLGIRYTTPQSCYSGGPSFEAPIATISSQLRIQSILSPPDPGADETPNFPGHSTPKRKYEDAFIPPDPVHPSTEQPPLSYHRLSVTSLHSDTAGSDTAGGPPLEARTPVPSGRHDTPKGSLPKMKAPMRSSIACLRCRRSKIKCDNDGGNSPCDTCIKAGHQCQYPEATFIPPKRSESSKRGDASGNVKQERETAHDRKRTKKSDDLAGLDTNRSAAHAAEVLSYPFLTEELWDQVFGLYKLHFATELPFLHLPTLKEQMSRKRKDVDGPSPDLNLVLLGILTLTARFHSDLSKYVAHISVAQATGSRSRQASARPDPSAAGDFFATALAAGLSPLNVAMTCATVERVQAFLMLGLYEWGQRRHDQGIGAWMYIGVAIRLAQSLRLGFDDTSGDLGGMGPETPSALRAARPGSEVGIAREVRRRTMFSCFILDRMLACGNERPTVIRPRDLEIQLPCTEMAFDLAMDVQTPYLRPRYHHPERQPNDDSVLSRFVQLVDIWGDLARYSVSGGRLADQDPWSDESTFRRLRTDLNAFTSSLPPTFMLSRQNYYRHDNHQATSMYVSLHLLASVCQIVLHREYLPCLPLRCAGPEGMPSSAPGPSRAPEGFWRESAEIVFRAARDILELIEICREKLPQSYLSLFATWMASLIGIYAHHFPWMDTNRYMVSEEEVEQQRATGEQEAPKSAATDVLYQALTKMVLFTSRGTTFIRLFEEVYRFYYMARSKSGYCTSPREADLPDNRGLIMRTGPYVDTLLSGAPSAEAPRSANSSEHREAMIFEMTSPTQQEGSSSRSGPDSTRNTPVASSMSFTAINNPVGFTTAELASMEGEAGGRRVVPNSSFAHLSFARQHAARSDEVAILTTERLQALEMSRISSLVNDLQEYAGVRF